nr:RNA-directed DNA polymerase, eukaryota [Tanacetum cinerariifolium]
MEAETKIETGVVRKKVYVCPEPSCVHHEPARALGDFTGIKNHFSRKHGEKKWKCEKCPRRYTVQSDWKARSKIVALIDAIVELFSQGLSFELAAEQKEKEVRFNDDDDDDDDDEDEEDDDEDGDGMTTRTRMTKTTTTTMLMTITVTMTVTVTSTSTKLMIMVVVNSIIDPSGLSSKSGGGGVTRDGASRQFMPMTMTITHCLKAHKSPATNLYRMRSISPIFKPIGAYSSNLSNQSASLWAKSIRKKMTLTVSRIQFTLQIFLKHAQPRICLMLANNTDMLLTHLFLRKDRGRAKDLGFVRFINIFNVDRLVNNLCTVWIDRFKLQANVARFQRAPLYKNVRSASIKDDRIRRDVNKPQANGGSSVSGKTFATAVKNNFNHINVEKDDSPTIVLDDECVTDRDLSKSLLGRVKVFSSLTNLKVALNNEGFVDMKVKYMGELWVLMEFNSVKSKDLFCDNVGVRSWFAELVPAEMDDPDENCYHSRRLCVYTKVHSNVFENYKLTFQGKVFWIRAKEVSGWVPELLEDLDEEELSENESLISTNKSLEEDKEADNGDMEAVPDTVFEDSTGKKENGSEDPFVGSPKTPNDDVDLGNEVNKENCDVDEGNKRGTEVRDTVRTKDDQEDSISVGRFKLSEAPRTGGSFLSLMEEVLKVGQTMGYNMEGVWKGNVGLMGDFNEVRYKSDRFGSTFNVQSAVEFNYFINDADLEDVPLGGKRYLSDHRPILLQETNYDYGPIPFRFFHHWFELDGFNKSVIDSWNVVPGDVSNGMLNLVYKLKSLKVRIREWIKDYRSKCNGAMDRYKEELRVLDEDVDKGQGSDSIANKRVETLNNICRLEDLHSMDKAQKAKVKWAIEGDENSRFFHGMLNKKRNQTSIRGIMVDGVWIEQPRDVKREFFSHFRDRFAKSPDQRILINMEFPNSISSEQQADSERLISREELKTAVWDCGTDKSPGPDGFTFGFYRQFWSTIENDVFDVVNHFFSCGDIPKGCNSSFIALIPKVPAANLVKDFRPISLIGSVYNITPRVL